MKRVWCSATADRALQQGMDVLIDYVIEEAEENQSPFFLASAHDKPAKDHAPYESKVYYDENWENYVPESEHNAIRAYIRNHKLMTIQDVTGEGIWFTLRRNCKHYLINISIDEVLGASAKALLKRHKMYMPEEAPVSREVLTYREYYNRLKIEEALNKLVPNEQLEKDLRKDKKLLDKWKNML